MNLLREVLAELVKMFLADARLTGATLMLVGAVAVLVRRFGVAPLFCGGLLLLGCLAILATVTTVAARRR